MAPGKDVSRAKIVAQARRLAVKVGTNVLSDDVGRLDVARIEHLAEQICQLRADGYAIAVVTSGAIGAGMAALSMDTRPKSTPKLQAAAAIGQSRLMSIYERCFQAKGYHAAQILLTREDFEDFRRYLNARRTFAALNKLGAIPVINENDTTATEEITFGDNDHLSAMVTSVFEADMLILLSTIDGLYDEHRQVVEVVERVTDDVQKLSFGEVSSRGVGGMDSKLQAIKLATDFGEPVVLANGTAARVLPRIMAGEKLGTLFLPASKRVHGRKRWLAFGGRTRGKLWIDDGAAAALVQRGRSLLPKGLVRVEGTFRAGDVVALLASDGELVAKGITAFSSQDAAKICGVHTDGIASLLGERTCDEVVHRDHMAIFSDGRPI